MSRAVKSLLTVVALCGIALPARAAVVANVDDATALASARTQAMATYKSEISPFVATYCTRCHGEKKRKGGVTFDYALKNPSSPSFRALWNKAASQVKSGDMPPEEEVKQPNDQERKQLVDWVAGMKFLSPKDPGFFVIRRLNKVEYGNTLHDLFGVDPQIAHDLPDEVVGAGYTNSLSPLLMEQYLAIANDVLNQVIAPTGKPATATQRRIFGDPPGLGADPRASARKVAQSFARQAFRRPPSNSELDLLIRVFGLATNDGKAYPDAIRLMVKAILVSPQFLFITPDTSGKTVTAATPGGLGDIIPLDDYQLAARLSYLIWATTPDAELSSLADSGKLHDPDVLAGQARRLLLNPRSRALFDGFGAQWLGLDKLAGKTFDPQKFPQMTTEMRLAMYDEARLFFDSVVRENRSLSTFINSDYSFLNARLASLYGLEGTVVGPEMRRVQFTNANRGGILTMPGVLAMNSFPNRTSAVNRGVWVLEQVLGEQVPPPPANVPALEKQEKSKVATLTLRQRTELHRTNPVCANCHKVLDPIGFGLENFDAIGRWRDRDDSGGPIDATGELPGGHKFATPRELKSIIAARADEFSRNLTAKLMAYALCRQLEGYDEVVVDQLDKAIAKDGFRMQTMVLGVVTSYPFTHRRVNSQGDVTHAK